MQVRLYRAPRPLGRVAVSLGLALLLAACAGSAADPEPVSRRPAPSAKARPERAIVLRVDEAPGLLSLQTHARPSGLREHWYVRDRPACRKLLRVGAELDRLPGDFPIFAAGNAACRAVGWGLRHPPGAGSDSPAELRRGQARFQVIRVSPTHALARGSFPLAAALGWPDAERLVAVVPRRPECLGPLERAIAPLELRAGPPPALSLLSEAGLCPIEGLVLVSAEQAAVGRGPRESGTRCRADGTRCRYADS